MATQVSISRLHFPVTTLGPGRRIGIWFQGCSIRCKGCISPDTWDPNIGTITVERVISFIEQWISIAEGFTISGGEPFDQPDALIALLREIRNRSTADTLVFTGFAYESVRPLLEQAAGLIDALVSDPFDLEADQSLALRGSDNQRLHFLTALGAKRFSLFNRKITDHDLRLDALFDDDGGVWFAGIPRREDIVNLRSLMEADGHIVLTHKDKAS